MFIDIKNDNPACYPTSDTGISVPKIFISKSPLVETIALPAIFYGRFEPFGVDVLHM